MKSRWIQLPLILLAAVAIFSMAASEQPALPRPQQSAAEKAAEAYFKAFNAGDEAMADFINKFTAKDSLQKTPLQARLDRYRQIRGQVGSLDPQKVVESRPNFVSVTARAQNGQPLRLDFEFESAEPFGLLGIRIEAQGEEGGKGPAPEPKKDDAELFAAVRDFARSASEAGDFSGVILIARNGSPIFQEAFGYADREKKIPNKIDTKFNIGSINKTFTSLAIQKLAAEKKLSLDDTIGKFLPDYPNQDAASRVMVRHLLEMSSGIGDFFGGRYDSADKEKILTLADYLPLFADRPLEFEPGKGGQIVRSAGSAAQLLGKEGKYCLVRLPSGEVRRFMSNCVATIGQIGNVEHQGVRLGKAGRTRLLGRRPQVRGSAMTPRDHPHGGGEGRAPRGMAPKTPWGKTALGPKTRIINKASDRLIVKRRK